MEEAFQAILDSLPPKAARSKLEPYAELIRELRKRGRSYRDIASILAEHCGVTVGIHTVYNFVQVRSKTKSRTSPGERERAVGGSGVAAATSSPGPGEVAGPVEQRTTAARASAEKSFNPDEARRKIEALKQRSVTPEAARKVFEYNPEEPLRLLPHSQKSE